MMDKECDNIRYRYNFSENWSQVEPDLIYNRFDLICKSGGGYLLCTDDSNSKYIPVSVEGRESIIGCWGMVLSDHEIEQLAAFIFKHFHVEDVLVRCAVPKGRTKYAKRNDYVIVLPKTKDELDKRLSSKGRYNIRRTKRIIEETFGDFKLCEYTAQDEKAGEIINKYFELKKVTHHTDYHLSPEKYAEQFYVSHIYTLEVCKSTEILAVLMTCEQCENVYLENLTYDIKYARLSPGFIAYDLLLKRLAGKGKKAVFLGDGNLEYKKRYGSIEREVIYARIYNPKLSVWIKQRYLNIKYHVFSKLPDWIKNCYRNDSKGKAYDHENIIGIRNKTRSS